MAEIKHTPTAYEKHYTIEVMPRENGGWEARSGLMTSAAEDLPLTLLAMGELIADQPASLEFIQGDGSLRFVRTRNGRLIVHARDTTGSTGGNSLSAPEVDALRRWLGEDEENGPEQ